MSGNDNDNKEISGWLSTYGLITAKRLLEHYKINISDKDLLEALKKPNSFIQRLLKVPMNNIFSGIILQQGKDYQIYIQKLFIDYLLSGESDKREEAPGGSTREVIEEERKRLVAMDVDFRDLELTHENLIAKSQEVLLKSANIWLKTTAGTEEELKASFAAYAVIKPKNVIKRALATLVSVYNFKDEIDAKDPIWKKVEEIMQMDLSPALQEVFNNHLKNLQELLHSHEKQWALFLEESYGIQNLAKQFRKAYADYIIKISELVQTLPTYKSDKAKTQENKETLYFDSTIGE